MFRMIISVLACYIAANFVVLLAGSYYMMFRTAMNGNLGPRAKLGWMVAQTFLPPASFFYAALIERNWKTKQFVLPLLVLGLAAAVIVAQHFPWDRVDRHFDKQETEIDIVQALGEFNPDHSYKKIDFSADSLDPVTAKVGKTMDRLDSLGRSDLENEDIYIWMRILVEQAAAAKVQKLSMNQDSGLRMVDPEVRQSGAVWIVDNSLVPFLDALNAALDRGPLRIGQVKGLIALARQSFAHPRASGFSRAIDRTGDKR